jgi:hypothetical protein
MTEKVADKPEKSITLHELLKSSRNLAAQARQQIRWEVFISPPHEPESLERVASLDIDDTILVELIKNWSQCRNSVIRRLTS